MREIKFRAYADGKMYYQLENYWWYFGSYNYWSLNRGDIPGEIVCDSLESENPHIMQYTGLRDKNGKEIYEGERVEFNWKPYFGEILWDNDDAGFFILNDDGKCPHVKLYFAENIKIIGNIHETPELLEEPE